MKPIHRIVLATTRCEHATYGEPCRSNEKWAVVCGPRIRKVNRALLNGNPASGLWFTCSRLPVRNPRFLITLIDPGSPIDHSLNLYSLADRTEVDKGCSDWRHEHGTRQ